jgi:RHS repeat-associated protein
LNGVSRQSCPNSPTVGFQYDNANRRTTLTLYSYDANGVSAGYTYDNASRVTGMTYSAGSTQLGNLTYSYDGDGRRTATSGSLAAVTLPAAASGNTFNADNGMTGFNGTTLSYDANGNLTGDGTNTYTWDARGHLSTISGGATASFVYDAFGRRMKKTIGSSTVTQFVYDRVNPVQELNGANPPAVTANLLTGLNIDEFFTRTASGTTSTLLADALGSTIGLVGSSGGIATSYTYQPFSGTTAGGAANTNPYQFTGRENDGTGLYFYRARYYQPGFQRFISQDPVGFAGGQANIYLSYVYDDAVDMLDPSGLSFLTKLWNGFNDIPGAIWGGVNVLAGGHLGPIGNNAIQIENAPLMPAGSAITLGNVICYGKRTPPPHVLGGPQDLGRHEMQHTIQGETLGPAYLPANILGGLYSEATSGDWHTNNPMETGPMSTPPQPWPP